MRTHTSFGMLLGVTSSRAGEDVPPRYPVAQTVMANPIKLNGSYGSTMWNCLNIKIAQCDWSQALWGILGPDRECLCVRMSQPLLHWEHIILVAQFRWRVVPAMHFDMCWYVLRPSNLTENVLHVWMISLLPIQKMIKMDVPLLCLTTRGWNPVCFPTGMVWYGMVCWFAWICATAMYVNYAHMFIIYIYNM